MRIFDFNFTSMTLNTLRLRIHPAQFILISWVMIAHIQAQIKAPFLMRYQTSIQGNMTLIGNNVLSLTPTGDYNGTLGNHSVTTVFVDVDTDTTTFNSSNATLVLPGGLVCPVVKKVFLYWSAADLEDPGNEPDWSFNQVKLRVPGSSFYTTIAADSVIYQGRLEHFYNDPYTCYKDITALIPSDPNGIYWVSNVKARKGTLVSHGGGNTGTSGGWIIVVIYESTTLPQKNIAIFDGYVHVATEMSPNPLPFTFSGFQTVPSGNVNVDFLMGALEGDWDLSGDYCQIQKTDGSWLTMSSSLRQTNNFFHSIIGLDGAQFLNRMPASQNTLGFDADKFPIPNTGNGVIANNQSSATIRMGTNQEIYGLFMIGLMVDVWYPAILTLFNIPAMAGGTGGSVNAGDTLFFSIVSVNHGNDAAQNLVLSTVIPPGIDFLNVIPPVPAGISYNYNNLTRQLLFSIPDNLVEVGDSSFTLQYKAKAITDCLLLRDSTISHGSCQVTSTFHGQLNPAPQTNLSSTGLTQCGLGNLSPATFSIIPPLTYPVAINDSATTNEDTQVAIPVLANDTDCDNRININSIWVISGPDHGTFSTMFNSGLIIYIPSLNYNGYDTLRYRICDWDNLCDTAWVYIHVLPVNDPPLVENDSADLCENTGTSGNVLTNDTDPVEHSMLTVKIPPVNGPSHGTIHLYPDGSYTYTPLTGYSGNDQVVISVCDSGDPLPPECVNDTLFIAVHEMVQSNAGADQQVCNQSGITLTGNIPAPGTGSWTQISGPGPVTIAPGDSSTAFASGLIPGLYLFKYSISNETCITSDTLLVHNEPPPSPASAGIDQLICLNGFDNTSTTLAANFPVTGIGNWSQSSGPGPALIVEPTAFNSRVSNLADGEYRFTWTISQGICPNSKDSVLIIVRQKSTVNAGPDSTICATETLDIKGSSATSYLTVQWATSGTGTFADASGLHTRYTPGAADIDAGHVMLILNATSQPPCSSGADTMQLFISPSPFAFAGPDGVTCETLAYPILGAGVQHADSLTWHHNGQGTLTGNGTLTPVYFPAPGEHGNVTLTITAFGNTACDANQGTDDMIIYIYHHVQADAGPDQSISSGSTAALSAEVAEGSGNYIFGWEPADLFGNNAVQNPVTLPLTKDTTFLLTVHDILSGCAAADSVRVIVTEKPVVHDEICLKFYNTITPNGDGFNDLWVIGCIENYPLNKVEIFNRWGDKINEFENYNNTTVVWNGTGFKGEGIPDGTYYYVFSVKKGDSYTGWVFVRGGSK